MIALSDIVSILCIVCNWFSSVTNISSEEGENAIWIWIRLCDVVFKHVCRPLRAFWPLRALCHNYRGVVSRVTVAVCVRLHEVMRLDTGTQVFWVFFSRISTWEESQRSNAPALRTEQWMTLRCQQEMWSLYLLDISDMAVLLRDFYFEYVWVWYLYHSDGGLFVWWFCCTRSFFLFLWFFVFCERRIKPFDDNIRSIISPLALYSGRDCVFEKMLYFTLSRWVPLALSGS